MNLQELESQINWMQEDYDCGLLTSDEVEDLINMENQAATTIEHKCKELKCQYYSEYWIIKGTKCTCQLRGKLDRIQTIPLCCPFRDKFKGIPVIED